jgi:hypothetical protein
MTDSKKRERPLHLEMDFREALERFAQTDPKEVTESIQRAKKKKPPGDGPARRPARSKGGDTPSPDRKVGDGSSG